MPPFFAASDGASTLRRRWPTASAARHAALLLVAWTVAAGAQGSVHPAPERNGLVRLLGRADSAFKAGDRELARRLYGELLAADSSQSRAVFQLARLEPSPERALPLYRRYVALEPQDPWGHMALGDALARLGRRDDALAAYDDAARLAPGERDVAIGRARVHSRGGDPDGARATLRAWLDTYPDDAEAWEMLGREELRAGRPHAARTSFERATEAGHELPPALLARARRESGPVVEPSGGHQSDSDGNLGWRAGAMVEFAPGDPWRLGVGARHGRIRDDFTSATADEVQLRAAVRPRADTRLQLHAGAARYHDDLGGTSWTTPVVDARLRWRAPPGGPAFDLRLQHLPLAVSPALVASEARRAEARATLELPAGPLKLRGMGRMGAVYTAPEPSNQRLGAGGALVLPLGWRAELSGQYHRLGYRRASQAGYFAPEVVETVEGGAYFELGDDGPLSIAADVGAGAQRIAEHTAPWGRWARALRGWGFASLALAPGRALWLEVEAYDAAFAPEGTATSESWRYLSVAFGLRWSMR